MGPKHKQERRRRAQMELEGRQRRRLEQSPLSREELEDLYTFVAQRVFRDGLGDARLALTRSWLEERDDAAAVLGFLAENRVTSDWEVLVQADPCELFGPTPTRLARMPIEASHLDALIAWVDGKVTVSGCDHDLTFARQWLADHALPIATTEFALIAQGGGCDCEVVLNVDPGRIYPPATLTN